MGGGETENTQYRSEDYKDMMGEGAGAAPDCPFALLGKPSLGSTTWWHTIWRHAADTCSAVENSVVPPLYTCRWRDNMTLRATIRWARPRI
jgi:hypothetical protein